MRILLGVTGGIAAYKALEFTRLAMKAGHAVRVVQTEASTRFVGTASFAGITGAPVLLTEWEPDPLRGAFPGDPLPAHAPLSHLALVEAADVYLIAPASANTIAKLAAGAADNLLTAAALARRGRLVVAPAMNDAMYEHAATQANLETLRARGVEVLDPGVGALGSIGEWGVGRLPEPADLLAAVEAGAAAEPAAAGGSLAGVRVLVTAGGTREPIDSVRYIGNRSSGRMGFALAAEAARRGAQVTVIAANVSLARASGIEYVEVETAADLNAAAQARFDACDVLLMAAAVADFRPAHPRDTKIKKTPGDTQGSDPSVPPGTQGSDPSVPPGTQGSDPFVPGTQGSDPFVSLELEPTEDVLSGLSARRRPGQLLVGFAAEHGAGALDYGRDKLARKGLDAVVVNDISRPDIGFDVPTNEVTILTAAGETHVPLADKADVARAILDTVLRLRSSSPERVGA